MDSDITNMMKWKTFLKENPEFRKWYDHHLKQALKRKEAISPSSDVQSGVTVIGMYGGADSASIVDLYGQVVGSNSRHDQVDLNDGEVLAWATGIGNREKVLAPSTAIIHVRPFRLDCEEALFAGSYGKDDPYLRILCARELHEDPGSKRTETYAKNARKTVSFINSLNDDQPHVVWNTDTDFVRTVCRYGSADILMAVRSKVVIDEDYLEGVLLAPRPDPGEVPEDRWHDMAVRLVDALDAGDSSLPFSSAWPFSGLMLTVLTDEFLGWGLESMTFMETVYRLFMTTCLDVDGDGCRKHLLYRPGLLDPKLFDMLREYGSSFVRPLMGNAMDRMTID